MNSAQASRDWLITALNDYEIKVLLDKGNTLVIEKEYIIEIEKNGVYKLIWKGKTVAPFQNLNELCHFIKES